MTEASALDRRLLRERAEARVANGQKVNGRSHEELDQLVQELQIHQVELELQNEELRRTQEALSESARQAEFLFHHAPVGYLMLDGKGVIHRANQTFSRFLGTEPRFILGRGLIDFVKEEDWGAFHGRFRAMFEQPVGKSMELSLRSGVCVLMDMARPETATIGLNGESLLLVTMSDITEFHRLQAEQRQIERQLLTAQKMESLGSLAGGVAHDMNNVLSAILGVAELHLYNQPERTPLAKGLQTIHQACMRGRSLVQGLLRLARRGVEEQTDVDLNQLVQEEAALLDRTTLRRVALAMELEPGLPLVRGDAAALSHALLNLCVNAVDAMPTGGKLTLRTRSEGGGGVLLEVVDTGSGMAPEVLERAIDPFFTTKSHGTGLGLALVYSTVKAHGGRVELESQVGQGTRISLHLPVTAETTRLEPAPVLQEPAVRPLTILVVDDEEIFQACLCEMLKMDGHEALSVSSGEEALALLGRDLELDVVILDLNMPGLGGRKTLQELKTLRPELPVLLDTGRADQDAADICASYPAVHLLPKPFTRAELQAQLVSFFMD